MNVLFLFHTYTLYPLERNTYQFDFKLHYQAYIIFMSFPLVYLFIFYFLNSHCIPICFNFSSWAAICFNKLVKRESYKILPLFSACQNFEPFNIGSNLKICLSYTTTLPSILKMCTSRYLKC